LQEFFWYDDMCSTSDHSRTTASVTWVGHKVKLLLTSILATAGDVFGPVPALH
jgi:hypothetical protein